MTLSNVLDLATPIRFHVLDDLVVMKMAALSGLDADQLRYMLCLFLVYPLALIFRNFLSNPTTKHLFSMSVGLILAQYVLKTQWLHSLFTATITYFLVKYCPVQYAPKLVFAFNMAYMTGSHIYRLYVDYMGWSLDFTGPQMLLVIKLTSFAYNYHDGLVEENVKVSVKVLESRRKYAIHHMPSLLEYFGYVYCFTTFLAGPAFEFKHYMDVMANPNFFLNNQLKKQPSTALPALKRFLMGVVVLAFFASYSPLFPTSILSSDEFGSESVVFQVKTVFLTLLLCRAKYYSAWKIAEGASVLCGFGFEGFSDCGNPIGWNGVDNVDILGFEFGQSIRDLSRAWNKGTQSWLERYVYSRYNNSLLVTYFVSAFWHGFYPGYYLFFLSVPLATTVNRLAHKRVRPWFLEYDGTFGLKKKVYDLISLISTILIINYLAVTFQVLSWENSIKALKNMRFMGHLTLCALYALFSVVPIRKFKNDTIR